MTEAGRVGDAGAELRMFKQCLPLQIKLQEAVRALGPVGEQACLDIGAENGMISYHLRKRGGRWQSVAMDSFAEVKLKSVLEDGVHRMDKGELPFKKKIFDAVVVFDALERVENDGAFIEECHRLLKPDGRLIVHVARAKRSSLAGPLRSALGVTPQKLGLVRPGYTESELFTILKHGFDVLNMRSYSRLFVEIVQAFVDRAMVRMRSGDRRAEAAARRACALAGPMYRIAFQLDLLLFFSRGYCLIATAKRRAWRSRKAPILVDGRSISEAVLSRPSV